jgi:transcriptional regulator with AAA-type ATPase domain
LVERNDDAVVDLDVGRDGVGGVAAEEQHVSARKNELRAGTIRIIDFVMRRDELCDRLADGEVVARVCDEVDPHVVVERFGEGLCLRMIGAADPSSAGMWKNGAKFREQLPSRAVDLARMTYDSDHVFIGREPEVEDDAPPNPGETVEIAVVSRTTSLFLEIQDDEEVRWVPISGTPAVVGSSASADIVIRDRTVSSRHCELAAVRNGIALRDLGSRNGTYVGGARVQDAWGAEGMTIVIGQTSMVCVASQEEVDPPAGAPLPGIAGGSTSMRRVATQVRRLARLRAPVLIAGETGVGKELVARALHVEGYRHGGPFVAINVAALPRELVESELFGHERGAFTGAVAKRAGAFVEAEGGTLFLDEIGELPIDAQPKLLRALDGYEVRRIGSSGSGQRADARVVAATHVPLLEHVQNGRFRRDLFHRLEVFVVELPPLRARPGDVLPIARMLLSQMEAEVGERELSPASIAQLTAHDWPGNVRELRNVLLRAADLSASGRWIESNAVARALRRSQPPPGFSLTPDGAKEWLDCHHGNISAAARAAKIPRTTFRKLLARAAAFRDQDAEGVDGS